MRIFEFALLATLFLAIPSLWIRRDRPQAPAGKATLGLLLIANLSLALHFATEGWRWQMVPTYALLFGLELATLWQLRRGPSRRGQLRRWVRALLTASAVSWWLAAFALPLLLPVPQLPTPTGPYGVGTRIAYLSEEARSDPYSDPPGRPRELMMQVWYPIDPTVSGEAAPYLSHLDLLAPVLSERLDFPAFFLQHIERVQTHALLNAPPVSDDGPLPVLVFAHGINSLRVQSTFLMEELASHGYVVAAVDHTYGATATVFPDGRVALYNPDVFDDSTPTTLAQSRTRLVQQWAADMALELETLAAWHDADGSGLFTGRLALDEVGVFGHSTGAGATVEFCARNARCDAVLLLDGWFEPVSDAALAAGISSPIMLVQQPDGLGNQTNKQRMRQLFDKASPAYRVEISGAGHFNFTDIPLLSPITAQLGLTGPIDGARGLVIVSDYALAFFDAYLGDNAKDPLLAGSPPYSEVDFDSRP
jgi:predicted dienelactone hydrolase